MGLDQPLVSQYFIWLSNMLQGDFGRSYSLNRPVIDEVLERFNATLILAGVSFVLCSLLGIMAGVISAAKQFSLADKGITLVVLLGISIPSFFLGMMMILLFAINLRWLPVSGMYAIYGGGDLPDLLQHLVMPVVALASVATGVIARLSRSAMLEVLRQDYIRTARAKGVHERQVVWKHALKAAMVSIIPVLGIQAGFVLSGAVYIEMVFQWPGVGKMLVEAILKRDILLVQGGVVFVATCYVLFNIAVDMLQSWLDPEDQSMTAFLKLLVRNRLAAFGGVVMCIIIFLVLITPLLGLQDPAATDTANRFLRPLSDGHLLGTDHLGRDLLSRLLWGTQLSLAVGFAAALIAALIGSSIGIIAGYYGGRVDNIFMRCIDVLMAFPYILLALAIVAALGPGLLNALIAVAAVNIPFFARNIRGVTVSLAQREFVEAAKLCGMSDKRIIWAEIVPNVIPVIVIAMSTTIGWMILETAGLSFLGLGSQPPQADLGSMLGEGRNALITDPHASVVPGVMIFFIVMSINLLGDGVRDALDPRLKSGALTRPQPTTNVSDAFNAVEADANNDAVLKVDKLETQFHINQRIYKAVNQVSFEIAPGECLGLIGESGSGKSVTALSVMGLVASPPGVICGGDIRFKDTSLIGADYETLRALRGKDVAYIFQDPLATLHPLYRVGEQMMEAIQVHEKVPNTDARARAIALLDAVHIPNAEERMNAFPHELSGGMRQRVAIAMALVNNLSLIIADEPTTALDVTVQGQTSRYLMNFAARAMCRYCSSRMILAW
ncbi:ABC transporter permease subunit [Enterovibrio sp. Hal110]